MGEFQHEAFQLTFGRQSSPFYRPAGADHPISAGRRNNGSRKGNRRRTGCDCPVTASGRTRSGCAFCQRYNDERPHEGIGNRTPSSLWCPSSRPYPERRDAPRLPGAHGDPAREHGRHVPAARASAVPQPRPRWRGHWPGRSRRWHLEHRLLHYVARQDGRTHVADYRNLAPRVRC